MPMSSFYEVSITLMPKAKDITYKKKERKKERKLQANYTL